MGWNPACCGCCCGIGTPTEGRDTGGGGMGAICGIEGMLTEERTGAAVAPPPIGVLVSEGSAGGGAMLNGGMEGGGAMPLGGTGAGPMLGGTTGLPWTGSAGLEAGASLLLPLE